MNKNYTSEFQKLCFTDRVGVFNEIWLPKLREHYEVAGDKNSVFTIKGTTHGIITFYVRGNKCFLSKKSRRIKPGFEWMVKNLLNDK